MENNNCPFCSSNNFDIICENKFAFAILDKNPVNEGHTLIIPKRHFPFFFEASGEEITAMYSLLHEAKGILDIQYEPSGYNIGVNVGYYAGQTIKHMHIHLIPRYKGDVDEPKGGIINFKRSI
ncbi:HIT family protein [Clostridium felsineum]|uniref:Protein hit n=1 Tax=Clostridium felsineum TaxID=36839 RepID=A0A1S8LBB7_9CLOT|nr:HIT family protein [Clostridium felsineum]URZ06892.1 Protein hit [Clostridium felsineum]URZ11924.1 Protein hit [Clostridium felsineum]